MLCWDLQMLEGITNLPCISVMSRSPSPIAKTSASLLGEDILKNGTLHILTLQTPKHSSKGLGVCIMTHL